MRLVKMYRRDEAPGKSWNHGVPVRNRLPGDQGWHRHPAAPFITPAPGNPSRRPLLARHPAPATMVVEEPSPVVERRPPPFTIGHPRPPAISIDPVPVGVRPPGGIDIIRCPHP